MHKMLTVAVLKLSAVSFFDFFSLLLNESISFHGVIFYEKNF